MRHINIMRLAPLALALGALALPGRRAAAQEHGKAAPTGPGIPESMRLEHAEIHDALTRATKAPGRVGAAARELAAVLHPHFMREEQIALPPLGLLAALARGDSVGPMRGVLPMPDSLRAELPAMLKEHVAIRAATMRMRDVARTAGNAEVVELAEKLALHARSEEEMFYPAALLVGDMVRMRMLGVRTAAGMPCPHMGARPAATSTRPPR